MGRAGWSLLAIVGAWAAYKLLAGAVGGSFSPAAQWSFVGYLIVFGLVAFTVFVGVKDGIEKFNAHNDWSRWAVFVPLAAVVVVAGGGWLWWVYFTRHHAMIIWPVVVAAIVAALGSYRQKAERHWKQIEAEAMREMPDIPNTSGASNPDDFKGW